MFWFRHFVFAVLVLKVTPSTYYDISIFAQNPQNLLEWRRTTVHCYADFPWFCARSIKYHIGIYNHISGCNRSTGDVYSSRTPDLTSGMSWGPCLLVIRFMRLTNVRYLHIFIHEKKIFKQISMLHRWEKTQGNCSILPV